MGDMERESEDEVEGDRRRGEIDRLRLRLRLLLRDGDLSLGSGTVSYYHQLPLLLVIMSRYDSPGQSRRISSNPYTDSSTTNTAHEQTVPPPSGTHPYPTTLPIT
jgi:hypothetical protein